MRIPARPRQPQQCGAGTPTWVFPFPTCRGAPSGSLSHGRVAAHGTAVPPVPSARALVPRTLGDCTEVGSFPLSVIPFPICNQECTILLYRNNSERFPLRVHLLGTVLSSSMSLVFEDCAEEVSAEVTSSASV